MAIVAKKLIIVLIFFVLIAIAMILVDKPTSQITVIRPTATPSPTVVPSPPLPKTKILTNNYHIFQTFNNCGPASLSMTLSYYGIHVSQYELGQGLRPFQVPGGDNGDKSVTLEEMAEKAKEYDLIPYHRPNGTIEVIKQFIANDIPVITRTWLEKDEDIGHYRVVKGYDDTTQQLIQDDSYQNKNLWYSYEDFLQLWEKFNYEYLVLIPPDKQILAEKILEKNFNEQIAWKNAVRHAEILAKNNPNDIYARFNLSVALYHAGKYKQSVTEFEKIEKQLPFRTLWYQIEPIQAYYELGEYYTVFTITDHIINNHNRAFSELYIIRGNIYRQQGKITDAKQEFEKAVYYNQNLKAAKDALQSIAP